LKSTHVSNPISSSTFGKLLGDPEVVAFGAGQSLSIECQPELLPGCRGKLGEPSDVATLLGEGLSPFQVRPRSS